MECKLSIKTRSHLTIETQKEGYNISGEITSLSSRRPDLLLSTTTPSGITITSVSTLRNFLPILKPHQKNLWLFFMDARITQLEWTQLKTNGSRSVRWLRERTSSLSSTLPTKDSLLEMSTTMPSPSDTSSSKDTTSSSPNPLPRTWDSMVSIYFVLQMTN